MILGFHHPGIVVPDLQRAREFYEAALGFEFIREYNWDESKSATAEQVMGLSGTAADCLLLKGNNCFLELFRYRSPESRGDPLARRACDHGIAHLAFQVSDIEAAFSRFERAGGIVHNRPVRVGEGWSIYCRDPFGNIIELMQIGPDEKDFDLIEEDLLPPGSAP